MEQITITAKIQIIVSDINKSLLNETMSVYTHACNYVSDYVFCTHDVNYSASKDEELLASTTVAY